METTILNRKEAMLTANAIRSDILAMLPPGKVGHLGGSSSIADIMSCLYFHHMNINPKNMKDPDRDRILLSKGHSVLAQYAALTELGVIDRNELKTLKTYGSVLQGHPDMERTPGIEAVTGSLGQGLSVGLGLALGLKLEKSKGRVYVICGDGELSEGQVWEAAMAGSVFKADNLTAIIDLNGIQATGTTEETFPIPNIAEKWEAFGWNVIQLDGHDVVAIHKALEEARNFKGKPSVLVARTIKGKGFSFAENKAAFHNGSLTDEQYKIALEDLEKIKNEVEKS
ncbi:transketolase [Oceanispirochaeta sp.]|jgi:transketolase|uniref:transketolase n=1 Tax=Oceanispirochaeta sp. TaxID=2035350 RepID=UPI0026237D8C|nr:transketolase [Oceanispirochaeta sp.]MDA3955585.1 transketolase [Oceanispirochaeta sp.]